MSRQFDQILDSGVCLNDNEFKYFVEPRNIKELMEAEDLRGAIIEVLNSKMNDEDVGSITDALKTQEGYIREYIKQIGDFDNQTLISNISFLTNKHGIGIGDLERILGISAGYISRTAKLNSAKKMSIDVVWKIARLFEIDIRILIGTRLDGVTPTEEYFQTFIDKLIRDTGKDKLDWKKEKADYLNCLELDDHGYTNHPLFAKQTFYRQGEEYPDLVTEIVFTSDSFGHNTYIYDDCYKLALKNGTTVYLMCVSKDVYRTGDMTAFAKELWLVNALGKQQIICRNNDKSPLASMVDTLYESVKEVAKHPKINDDLRHAIDSFMIDDLEDDEDFCPY